MRSITSNYVRFTSFIVGFHICVDFHENYIGGYIRSFALDLPILPLFVANLKLVEDVVEFKLFRTNLTLPIREY